MQDKIETERKYIIAMPCVADMAKMEGYRASDIEQIYLDSAIGLTHRIRKRVYNDRVEYTETVKRRISATSNVECEEEITEGEYLALKEKIRGGTRVLNKTRHVFYYLGQLFEVDIYPEWKRTAIMETELEDEACVAKMPEFINILEEVTGKKEYSNSSMSHIFPKEK